MELYKITHPATNQVVNLYIGSQTGPVPNGTRLSLYSWQNNNDQKWQLEYMDGSTLLRLARDTNKVMNRNSSNNNAHVWAYDGTTATKNDSLVATETIGGNTRIKLVRHGLYLTKNANDSFLSWAGKIQSDRQYFEMVKVSSGGGSGGGEDKYQNPCPKYTHVSTEFGVPDIQGKSHRGIDLVAATRTPVYAWADGVIARRFDYPYHNTSSSGNDTMGNCLFVHSYNPDTSKNSSVYIRTLYEHLNNFSKQWQIGEVVKKGQLLGYVGQTGMATGSHLHFGMQGSSSYLVTTDPTVLNPAHNRYEDRNWINPRDYLNF